MSTLKGNANRRRPQKHQNKTAFRNDLHDKSNKIKFLNTLEVSGVCNRCKDIIQWKIKYKKYKTLTAPSKCVGCEQKNVKYAYHVLCSHCSSAKKACAKCCKLLENEKTKSNENQAQNEDIELMIKGLPERKRRTILRCINKMKKEDQVVTSDVLSYVQDLVSKIGRCNDDGFDFSSDDDLDSDVND